MKKSWIILLTTCLLTGCAKEPHVELPDNSKYYSEKSPSQTWPVELPDPIFEGNYVRSDGNDYFIDCRKNFYGVITKDTVFIKEGKVGIPRNKALEGIDTKAEVLAVFDSRSNNEKVNWLVPYPETETRRMQENVSILIVGMEMEEGMTYYDTNFRELRTYQK